MPKEPSKITLLTTPSEVAPFVPSVQAAADREKNALGFLPARVYQEAADQGKLLVATVGDGESRTYVGHILFGGVYPNARIFQVYVEARYRRLGIGSQLVQEIVKQSESLQFLSVRANVANDLEANVFWEYVNFELARKRSGGVTTNRVINVRVLELNTPRLFRVGAQPQEEGTIGLIGRLPYRAPLYVIDLNVLFDVVKGRPRAQEAGKLINASLSNLVRLAVTEEFVTELNRTTRLEQPDPILELARHLPTLRYPPSSRLQQLRDELASLVFSAQSQQGTLDEQDRSDLSHLAVAVHHSVAGFITSEKAILRARTEIRNRYGMDIVGVGEFAEMVTPIPGDSLRIEAICSGHQIRATEFNRSDEPFVRESLSRLGMPEHLLPDLFTGTPETSQKRVLVLCDGAFVALAVWDTALPIRQQITAFVCGDEDHGLIEVAMDYLLESICRESAFREPVLVNLKLLPRHSVTRGIAIGHGFQAGGSDENRELQKLCVGTVISHRNLETVAPRLERLAGLKLPPLLPQFRFATQGIPIVGPLGQSSEITLTCLETLLSPVLFILPGRPCAVVPIRRNYSEQLLGGSTQASLLTSPEAIMLRERVYFSSMHTASVLAPGTPILFYESKEGGGRGAIVAAARIVRSDLVAKDSVGEAFARRGVLGERGFQKISVKAALVASTFDNTMLLNKPVPWSRIRELGCVSGANFVTAQRMTTENFLRIIEEASR